MSPTLHAINLNGTDRHITLHAINLNGTDRQMQVHTIRPHPFISCFNNYLHSRQNACFRIRIKRLFRCLSVKIISFKSSSIGLSYIPRNKAISQNGDERGLLVHGSYGVNAAITGCTWLWRCVRGISFISSVESEGAITIQRCSVEGRYHYSEMFC